MNYSEPSRIPGRTPLLRSLLTGLFFLLFLSLSMLAADDARGQTKPFPDSAALLAAVVQHERATDPEMQSLVFEDHVAVSGLDASGHLLSTRTEICYFNAIEYRPFALHIATNDKSLTIPFLEILGRSRLVPLQWSQIDETPVVVFSFEPQSPIDKHGDLKSRVASDLRGTVWISPSDASIVRLDFRTVLPISLGWGHLGTIDSLNGFVQLREGANNLWLPARQQLVTQGKNAILVIAGIRLSKKFRTQQTDDLIRYEPSLDIVQAQLSHLNHGD
jgi:hypothetical protein